MSQFVLVKGDLPPSDFAYTDSAPAQGVACGNANGCITGGKTYEYYVIATNHRFSSEPSTSFKVTPIQIPSGMAAPVEVTHDTSSITVKWTPPSDNGKSEVTRYLLYIMADYEASYRLVFAGLSLSYRV